MINTILPQAENVIYVPNPEVTSLSLINYELANIYFQNLYYSAQQYCWWDGNTQCSSEYSPGSKKDLYLNTFTEAVATSDDGSSIVKPALQRKRKNPIPDIKDKIEEVYKELKEKENFIIYPRNKGNRGLHGGLSKRRSRYVGVSKNCGHWQALINVGKTKKYIGSFCTEKEAALMYDFFAFGIHGLKAKTNFKHYGSKILRMIESYMSCGNKFNPSLFTGEF